MPKGDGVFKDSHGNDVIAAYTRVDFFGLPWGLCAASSTVVKRWLPLSTISADRRFGRQCHALVGSRSQPALSPSIVLCAGFYVSMRIVKPLRKTVDLLRDIAEGEGDLTRSLDDSSKDELGELAHWFNAFRRQTPHARHQCRR